MNTKPAPSISESLDIFPELGVDVKHLDRFKHPMLIVGANNYVRQCLVELQMHELLQTYDIHLFFSPNANNEWHIGAMLFHRTKINIMPVFKSISDKNIQHAFKELFGCIANDKPYEQEVNPKLVIWYILLAYRCSKITLKDVLHLEEYK